MRQVLQSVIEVITKCDDYYKVRQYKRPHTSGEISTNFGPMRTKISKEKKFDQMKFRPREISGDRNFGKANVGVIRPAGGEKFV